MAHKHLFALFYPDLSLPIKSFEENMSFSLKEYELLSRLNHVLRTKIGDTLLFFDPSLSVECTVVTLSKKEIVCTINRCIPHARTGTDVTVLMPLLKKENFDTTLYALAEIGVTSIQLITTQKIQRGWNSSKDYARAQKIIIAAAEQSKCFSMPTLYEPVSLNDALHTIDPTIITRIVADPDGNPLANLLCTPTKIERALVAVGPEGGFTPQELETMYQKGFTPFRLTPTILTAAHASIIMTGLLRSLYYKN